MDPIQAIGIQEIGLRLGMAVFVGGILGLNRELHQKPAGLRTHALVTLGAAIITISSLNFTDDGHITHPDALSRVIQGIITGVGFLGAGVIIRDATGIQVHGLTTAATVWCAASLGVVCGLGYWRFLGLSAAALMLVLIVGGPIERISIKYLRKWVLGEKEDR